MSLAIHFTGTNLAKERGISRADLVEAVNFYLDKLVSKRMKNSLTLFINLKEQMPGYGNCTYLDDMERPKEFDLEIKVNEHVTYKALMRSIAHELVHVKQFCTGEMRDHIRSDHTSWKKEKFDTAKLDYWFQPWEIEAHGMEVGLYTHFRRYKRKQKNKSHITKPSA